MVAPESQAGDDTSPVEHCPRRPSTTSTTRPAGVLSFTAAAAVTASPPVPAALPATTTRQEKEHPQRSVVQGDRMLETALLNRGRATTTRRRRQRRNPRPTGSRCRSTGLAGKTTWYEAAAAAEQHTATVNEGLRSAATADSGTRLRGRHAAADCPLPGRRRSSH